MKYKKDLSGFGRWLDKTRCLRFYSCANKLLAAPSLRMWHPVSWLVLLVFIPYSIVMPLFTDATIQEFFKEIWKTITVDKYYKQHPDELIWLKREDLK